jgi:hypothetical protein
VHSLIEASVNRAGFSGGVNSRVQIAAVDRNVRHSLKWSSAGGEAIDDNYVRSSQWLANPRTAALPFPSRNICQSAIRPFQT